MLHYNNIKISINLILKEVYRNLVTCEFYAACRTKTKNNVFIQLERKTEILSQIAINLNTKNQNSKTKKIF